MISKLKKYAEDCKALRAQGWAGNMAVHEDDILSIIAENEALKASANITLSGCEFNPLDIIEQAVRNMKGPSKYRNKWGTVRWALVRDAFGVGSGVATALCRRFGFDPDEVLRS
jgi:hypothetical protein